ncbi:MAG: NADAR family protein [Myxococcales bacterium]|nr:NADAR family protein [Myxococcales bacterium]
MCFWGHTPHGSQAVGPWVLSQWLESPFEVDGATYRTAEHWMMAGKATLFGDGATRDQILSARTPGEAKALGRRVRGFHEAAWQAHRMALVVEGNVHKFSQHPALGEYLRSTARRVLVEASPVDRVWGIGLAADHPDATQPQAWRGLNLLGFALMEARARL